MLPFICRFIIKTLEMRFLSSVVFIFFLFGCLLLSCKTSNGLKFQNPNKSKDYQKEIPSDIKVDYSYDSMKNVLENYIQQAQKELKIRVY